MLDDAYFYSFHFQHTDSACSLLSSPTTMGYFGSPPFCLSHSPLTAQMVNEALCGPHFKSQSVCCPLLWEVCLHLFSLNKAIKCLEVARKAEVSSCGNLGSAGRKLFFLNKHRSSSPVRKGRGNWAYLDWRRGGSGKTSLWPSSTWRECINRRGNGFLWRWTVIRGGGMMLNWDRGGLG